MGQEQGIGTEARFQLLASRNHPHISAIYGLENSHPPAFVLMVKTAPSETAGAAQTILVVQNWFEELRRLVPAR